MPSRGSKRASLRSDSRARPSPGRDSAVCVAMPPPCWTHDDDRSDRRAAAQTRRGPRQDRPASPPAGPPRELSRDRRADARNYLPRRRRHRGGGSTRREAHHGQGLLLQRESADRGANHREVRGAAEVELRDPVRGVRFLFPTFRVENPMRRITVICLAVLGSTLSAQTPYKTPPQVIVDILDAPPLPVASISPDRQWLLLLEQRSMPTIAELAQPMLRLAGNRINPRTSGPQLPGGITGLVLKRVADETERRVNVPTPAALSYVIWSPDSRNVAFVQTRDSGLVLWVADAASGQTRALTGATLNATNGPPCQWMPVGTNLLCEFVPDGRGPAPVEPETPVGPTIQETRGRAAPAPTFEDLLKNHFDEQLFDYYFTAQL